MMKVYERAESTVKVAQWIKAWSEAEALAHQDRWWDAHEVLEELWQQMARGPARPKIRALIQLMAACHKPIQAMSMPADRPKPRFERGMASLLAKARTEWTATDAEGPGQWVAEVMRSAHAAMREWERTDIPTQVTSPNVPVSAEALKAWWCQFPHSA